MSKFTTRAYALVFFLFSSTLLAADDNKFVPPPITQPTPDELLLSYSTSLITKTQPKNSNPDLVLLQARGLLEQSRKTGSLRPIGRALALLQTIPPESRDLSYQLMLATLEQRLHLFDKAQARLQNILLKQPYQSQALLTFYSIALVKGDYDNALDACQKFPQAKLGLLAMSCRYNILGLKGNPEQAFTGLHKALENYSGAPRAIDYRWALVTRAELAQSIAHPNTEFFWKTALRHSPNDYYAAAEFSEWLIEQERYPEALALLADRPDSDRFAVLKAMALLGSGSTQAEDIKASLQQRFTETRASGDETHLREYAQYLLEIEQNPDEALVYAELNWRHQKERADYRLLQKARQGHNLVTPP